MKTDKYITGDVISLKLVTGEEVVAKFAANNYDYEGIVVDRPMILTLNQDSFGLVPLVLTIASEHGIEINNSVVVADGKTEEQFKNAYLEKTTGLSIITR